MVSFTRGHCQHLLLVGPQWRVAREMETESSANPGDALLRVPSAWVMTLAFVSRAVRHICN